MNFNTILKFLVLSFLIPSVSLAEELNDNMREAYKAFEDLQSYMQKSEKFEDSKNEVQVNEILAHLDNTFHKSEKMNDKYTSYPGFVVNLNHVSEIINDASKRFKEGKKSYAYWRLKNLSAHCFASSLIFVNNCCSKLCLKVIAL